MKRLVVVFASLALALSACRGDDGGNNSDDTPADDQPGSDAGSGSNAGQVTIKQVQDDAMASGTKIELKGVVVIAVDKYGAKTGDLYVEDADGGAFSGVKVFGAPLDAVATLMPGDVVDITNAQKNEFACTTAICGFDFDAGFSVTEVESVNGGDLSVVKTGSGAVPAPAVVDALAISAMPKAQQQTEWEKWEGVYIKVTNARQVQAAKGFGGMADDQHSFPITGIVNVESVLAPFSADAVAGVCFAGITGIGDYFGDYLVLPTAESSTAGGGTGCAPLTTATVAQVQAGTATGSVLLQNLIITGRDEQGSNKGFWVSSAAQSAPNEGIYIYMGSPMTLSATYAIGATVDVIGSVSEFDPHTPGDTLTEIGNASVTVKAATATPIPAAAMTTDVNNITSSESYESVLVKLTGLKVTAATAMGKTELTDKMGNKVTLYNDAFAVPDQTLGTCYKSVTGIMSVELTADIRTLNPRSATDLEAGVAGTDCN